MAGIRELPKKKDCWFDLDVPFILKEKPEGEDVARIRVDYPTDAQNEKLKALQKRAQWVFKGETQEFFDDLKANPTKIMEDPRYLEYEEPSLAYQREYVTCVVKEWDNLVEDSKGNLIPAVVKKGRLSDKSRGYVTNNDNIMVAIFLKAQEILELSDTDKKKLN